MPIAIATDCNPGTSPLLSPTLAMNMACTLFGLTPEEALAGMTINAARALGLAHEVGSIAAGKAADLCVWRIESLAELGYWIGLPGPERRIFGGVRQLTDQTDATTAATSAPAAEARSWPRAGRPRPRCGC